MVFRERGDSQNDQQREEAKQDLATSDGTFGFERVGHKPTMVYRANVRNGWKADIVFAAFASHDTSMSEYQCWFCGHAIDRADKGAVMLTVENLWLWDAGSKDEDDPLQSVYCHTECAKERLQGATMALEPSVFLEED